MFTDIWLTTIPEPRFLWLATVEALCSSSSHTESSIRAVSSIFLLGSVQGMAVRQGRGIQNTEAIGRKAESRNWIRSYTLGKKTPQKYKIKSGNNTGTLTGNWQRKPARTDGEEDAHFSHMWAQGKTHTGTREKDITGNQGEWWNWGQAERYLIKNKQQEKPRCLLLHKPPNLRRVWRKNIQICK